jgi:hypothetical protein
LSHTFPDADLVTRITSADQLAAVMRAQIAALRPDRGRSPATKPASGKRPSKSDQHSDAASIASERINCIPPDDPDRADKALRTFLECVLISELGADLVNDPSFARMVDHVQQQIRADAELAAVGAEAARVLLQHQSSGAER